MKSDDKELRKLIKRMKYRQKCRDTSEAKQKAEREKAAREKQVATRLDPLLRMPWA